jgi:hypothetical protein
VATACPVVGAPGHADVKSQPAFESDVPLGDRKKETLEPRNIFQKASYSMVFKYRELPPPLCSFFIVVAKTSTTVGEALTRKPAEHGHQYRADPEGNTGYFFRIE